MSLSCLFTRISQLFVNPRGCRHNFTPRVWRYFSVRTQIWYVSCIWWQEKRSVLSGAQACWGHCHLSCSSMWEPESVALPQYQGCSCQPQQWRRTAVPLEAHCLLPWSHKNNQSSGRRSELLVEIHIICHEWVHSLCYLAEGGCVKKSVTECF